MVDFLRWKRSGMTNPYLRYLSESSSRRSDGLVGWLYEWIRRISLGLLTVFGITVVCSWIVLLAVVFWFGPILLVGYGIFEGAKAIFNLWAS